MKVSVELDDELFAFLKDACRRYDVSQSAALARLVMPWNLDTGPECRAYRQMVLDEIVTRARERDYLRRRPWAVGVGSKKH